MSSPLPEIFSEDINNINPRSDHNSKVAKHLREVQATGDTSVQGQSESPLLQGNQFQMKKPKLDEARDELNRSRQSRPDGSSEANTTAVGGSDHANVVAEHYNNIEEKGKQGRFESPIFFMRNFNNWVKSVLISTYVDKLREHDYGRPLFVLDLCCGKGGDLLKWQKARIKHLVCADIASVSIQQCRSRYEDMSRGFTAEFITADCTRERLREKYTDASIRFDVVSCQFGFHYCFESLPQAECMLRNISECLRPGGFFIGTLPNSYEIMARYKRSGARTFGNKLFNIKLLFDDDIVPLFGAKYDFQLEGVVDCPEFLVHFPTLTKLAAKFGLELVMQEKFDKFFENNQKKHFHLLSRMKVFESYPRDGSRVADPSEFQHAECHLQAATANTRPSSTVGTMSKSEWDVATVYMVFAFKKCKSTLDADGKEVYTTHTQAGRAAPQP